LDYFYSLVELRIPSDDDLRVINVSIKNEPGDASKMVHGHIQGSNKGISISTHRAPVPPIQGLESASTFHTQKPSLKGKEKDTSQQPLLGSASHRFRERRAATEKAQSRLPQDLHHASE
jgi:hypothetical protein